MRFAIISDIHVAEERMHRGVFRKLSRYSLEFLEKFVETMNGKIRPSFVVNLGDAISDRSFEADIANYESVLKCLGRLACPVYHAVGNHEQWGIPEEELLRLLGRDRLYYSFDCEEYHGIVLFSHDRERTEIMIDDEQTAWLEQDLRETSKKTIVFVHHLLAEQDLEGNFWFRGDPGRFLIHNRADVRRLLERSGKVIAVFNGHAHWNRMNVHNGIPYFTVQSLVENFNSDDVPSGCWTVVEANDKSIDVDIVGQDNARFHHNLIV